MSNARQFKRAVSLGIGPGLKAGLLTGFLCSVGELVVVAGLDDGNSAGKASVIGVLFASVIYGSIMFCIQIPKFASVGASLGVLAAYVVCASERPRAAPMLGSILGAIISLLAFPTSFDDGIGPMLANCSASGFGVCCGALAGVLVRRKFNGRPAAAID